MKTCPRCESSIDEGARYCAQCGAPQTEGAAEEFDEHVKRQARQVATESGVASGSGPVSDTDAGDGSTGGLPAVEELTDREQLWRRGCYVLGYATIVVALTRLPAIGAVPLFLGGIAILPPVRRLTAEPLGSPLKREAMAGLYAVFALIAVGLFVVL